MLKGIKAYIAYNVLPQYTYVCKQNAHICTDLWTFFIQKDKQLNSFHDGVEEINHSNTLRTVGMKKEKRLGMGFLVMRYSDVMLFSGGTEAGGP